MDLKSFLKWEEPIVIHGNQSRPQVYITRRGAENKSTSNIKMVFNSAWCRDNLVDIVNMKEKGPSESVGIAVSIARDKKIDVESIFIDLEEAMISAARKHFGF